MGEGRAWTPVVKRGTATGPREGAKTCEFCSRWPAPRVLGDHQRVCEDCYKKVLAEESSAS